MLEGNLTEIEFIVKIADFGVSKELPSGFDRLAHTPCGTPFARAPEAMKGFVDHRADVWGIGVIAYMLLTTDLLFKD